MPELTSEIIIVAEHQPHLNVLDIRANISDVMTWADIKAAYKKRALIVHPDKGGSQDAFNALNDALNALENQVDNVTYDPIGAIKDKAIEENEFLLGELRDAGIAIPTTTKVYVNGMEIECINNIDAYLDDCSQRKQDEAREQKIAMLGYTAFGLGTGTIGSIFISLMIGTSQINSTQTRVAGLCGAGLLVSAGYLLIGNGFFARDNNSQRSRQGTELESLYKKNISYS